MDLFLYEFKANHSLSFDESLALPVLEVKTCQRTFFMSWSPLAVTGYRRSFKGPEAYEFLLRFACGLESEIKGETDVFGQLRLSIKSFTECHPELNAEQIGLFSRLFEDTKEIRAVYLQGIGGNTYGALARRVLGLEQSANSRVLILGAGQISKSVAPYFGGPGLTLYNRSPDRLFELKASLEKKGYFDISYTVNSDALAPLIHSNDILIVATPVGSDLDTQIIDSIRTLPKERRPRILHLGGQSHELQTFQNAGIEILSLSDLFLIEKEQSLFRGRQIKQAEDACRSRSILRSLARSIHIPHGWEDLALFY